MQTIHLLPAYLLNAIKYSFHLTCNSPVFDWPGPSDVQLNQWTTWTKNGTYRNRRCGGVILLWGILPSILRQMNAPAQQIGNSQK